MNKKNIIFFSTGVFLVILDQYTKFLVRYFRPNIKLTGFFSINYITNTGMAFGLLKGHNIIFLLFCLAFLGAIIFSYKTIMKKGYALPFMFITAGVTGNMIDRIFLGHVVDFINFSFWPAFNVADSCLTIGFILLAVYLIKKK